MEKRILTGILVLLAGWFSLQIAHAGETTVTVSFTQDQVMATEIADVTAEEGTTSSGGGCFVGTSNGGTYSPTVYYLLNIAQDDVFMEGEEGAPFLPVKVVKVLIPFNAAFEEVVVADRRSSFLGHYRILPTQVVIRPEETAPFTGPDSKYYSLTDEYPAKPVEFGDQGSMRGYRIVTLKVFPLQYIPATDEVFLNEVLTLTVRWQIETQAGADRMSGPNNFQFDPAFAQIVRNIVSNSEEEVQRLAGSQAANWASTSSNGDQVEYLVITDETLTDAFQPLVDWKTKKGVPASLLTTADIYAAYTGTDNQQKIKKAIQDYVQNRGTLWVLLGGDDTVVPDRDCYGSVNGGGTVDSTIPTDLYYASLDYLDWNSNGGNACETTDTLDMEYDVFVGRAPVRTSAQAAAFVNKSIVYDKTPPQNDFAEKMLLMGTELWSVINGHSDAYWKSELMYETYIFPNWDGARSQFYDTATSFSGGAGYQLSPTNVSDQFNSGYNFAFMATHGNWSIWAMESPYGYFYNSTALNLANGARQGHVYTIACITSKFDGSGDPSLAEAFLRSETGGAVSYIGSSRYGWGYAYTTAHGPSFQYADSFYQNLFTGQPGGYANRLGAVFSAHKQDHIAGSAYYGANRWLQFSLNLLGDPELYVHTKDPQTLNVSHPVQLTTGSQIITIDAGVSGLLVCLSKGDEVYVVGQTDAQGIFEATTSPVSDGIMTVTVSGPNYVAYEGEVEILTVTGPPVINRIPDASIYDTEPYTGPTPTLSQGTMPVVWSLPAGPAGMTIDADTGVVTWPEPVLSDTAYTITIRAENNEGYEDETWLLTVNPGPVNLALNETTWQSSIYPTGGSSDRAVDGDINGDYSQGSVALTSLENQPWWTVDLGSIRTIDTIKVYNRTDAGTSFLSNFYVFVSETPFETTSVTETAGQSGVWSHYYAGEPPVPLTLDSSGVRGRYVRVQLTGNSYLCLAEVEVWGQASQPEGPVINYISDDSIEEDTPYTGPTPSLSQGTPPIVWSLSSGPAGMTINGDTGIVSWPGPTSAGSPHSVTIRAENSGGFDEKTWQVAVTQALPQEAPSIEVIPDEVVIPGNAYTGPTPTLSRGTGPITWYLISGPAGMTIDSDTGVVSWPTPNTTGSPYQITIQAENAIGSDDTSWQLTVIGATENVALNKTATQSTTYPYGGTADRAVDGDTNGDWNQGSVSVTTQENQPWWTVDLGDIYTLDTIKVYNRTDAGTNFLNNFYVFVSDTPFESTDVAETLEQSGVLSHYHAGEPPVPLDISLGGATGRYIRVQIDGNSYLCLAEVVVNGAASTPKAPVINDMPAAAVPAGNSYMGDLPVLAQGTQPITWSLVTGPSGITIDSGTGRVFWGNPIVDSSPYLITISAENVAGRDDASWFLTVTDSPVNLALNRPTNQSSVYPTGGSSERAVDGDTNGDYQQGSVALTSLENQPWWTVDLGGIRTIDTINIYNRTDAGTSFLSDFYVFVSEIPFESTDVTETVNQAGVWSHYQTGEPLNPLIVSTTGLTGRYVRVQLTANSYLSLAEVEVWGRALLPESPIIDDIPDSTVEEGMVFTGPVPSLLQGSAPVTWRLTDGPPDMIIDTDTGVVSWSDPIADNSPYVITIMAENSVGYDEKSWSLTVTLPPPAQAPSIAPIPDEVIFEGTDYVGPSPTLVQGTNPITWSLVFGPSGMTIDTSTGAVSGPTPDISGSPYTITIRAENAGGYDEASRQLTVMPVPENVALNKPAMQSSTYPYGGTANCAVDGNTNGDWNQGSVSVTNQESQAWLMVDLGTLYSIDTIKVYNRTDAGTAFLSNFYVFVSQTPFVSNDVTETINQPGVWSYFHAGEPPVPLVLSLNGKAGRYVRVQLAGTNYLCLAELEVMGIVSDPKSPVINPISNATVGEGLAYTSTIPTLAQGTQPITWSLTAGPSGMTIDSESGQVYWNNPAKDGSPYTITIKGENSVGWDEISWVLTVTEGSVNLALNKPVTQSSDYTSLTGAERAVDGNTDGDYYQGSVSVTALQYQPWWTVDLGQVQTIDNIKVYNRTDAGTSFLSDFYVFVSETPFNSTSIAETLNQTGVWSYYHAGEAPVPLVLPLNGTGRYVRVQLTANSYLCLAEVQVMGLSASKEPIN